MPSSERGAERRQHKASFASTTTADGNDAQTERDHASSLDKAPPQPSLGQPSAALLKQLASLRNRLKSLRSSFSLLLIYATIFMDFMGLTLLTPSMRFLVDADNPGAFEDYRCEAAPISSTGLPGSTGLPRISWSQGVL